MDLKGAKTSDGVSQLFPINIKTSHIHHNVDLEHQKSRLIDYTLTLIHTQACQAHDDRIPLCLTFATYTDGLVTKSPTLVSTNTQRTNIALEKQSSG